MGQLKFQVDDKLLKEFKQIVLAKHGSLKLSAEGQEVIRMYVNRHKHLLRNLGLEEDPLNKVIGALESSGPVNALRDLKGLEEKRR